jgi:transitional endoplasmic reticulum ATPase
VEHYIAGETLAERMLREPISTLYDIRQVLSGVLKGLQYLHSLSEPVIHNEITPQNIMIDLSGKTPVAKLIDFGYARSFMQSSKTYNKDGLNLQYVSNECITTGVFSPQSDLFSVGVVLYQMLFGMLPYSLNNYELQITNQRLSEANYKKLLEQREKNLRFPDVAGRIIDFDNSILNILQKALQNNSEQRFQSAIDFLQALNGDVPIENFQSAQNTVNGINLKKYSSDKSASGFAAIAGMQELKTMLQSDVIDIIQNPEEYRLHNLGLPNGMLLYGPPGCGKTFFAEKFAEETGYNFIKVKTSDIASTYVHGTQEKIGKIFDEARAKAPTILYFDELDAMTPDRENVQRSYASEVNEFLSQLDNIGDSGVFVIASTNKPQLIDKAVIRAGRLEKHFYVPPPDFEARRAMFELYLKNRPLVFGIDYEKLATLTENYVSSEIKLIVDEASRKVIREKQKRISMEILETVIKNQRPTMSLDVLRSFEKIKNQMLGIKEEHPEIGP